MRQSGTLFSLLVALVVLVPTTASAAGTAAGKDAAGQVRSAEISFAKAFADRDRDKFFSFLAEDAVFITSQRLMSGKPEVVAVWSQYFTGPAAPFSWKPERVVTNAAGDLGLSTGPVFDPQGRQIGCYWSTWQQQSDGSWKVLFDGGSPPPCSVVVP